MTKKKKYKYRINELIDNLPRKFPISRLLDTLAEYGVLKSTFYRDRNTEVSASYTIPNERLEIYAALFSVEVDDLKNFTDKDKKIKPIV